MDLISGFLGAFLIIIVIAFIFMIWGRLINLIMGGTPAERMAELKRSNPNDDIMESTKALLKRLDEEENGE